MTGFASGGGGGGGPEAGRELTLLDSNFVHVQPTTTGAVTTQASGGSFDTQSHMIAAQGGSSSGDYAQISAAIPWSMISAPSYDREWIMRFRTRIDNNGSGELRYGVGDFGETSIFTGGFGIVADPNGFFMAAHDGSSETREKIGTGFTTIRGIVHFKPQEGALRGSFYDLGAADGGTEYQAKITSGLPSGDYAGYSVSLSASSNGGTRTPKVRWKGTDVWAEGVRNYEFEEGLTF